MLLLHKVFVTCACISVLLPSLFARHIALCRLYPTGRPLMTAIIPQCAFTVAALMEMQPYTELKLELKPAFAHPGLRPVEL